jgi:hypothetical protein
MIDQSNYLFILANQGAGGHQLGRKISSLDCVYWYSCERNGLLPTDVYPSNEVTGKLVSHNHYDRMVGTKMVPLVGERIELWWHTEDIDYFYEEVWSPQMTDFSKILDTQYLHWILHDTPLPLLTRFPNAKIISLIDTDIDNVTDRYLKTTAKFPAYYRMTNLKPQYITRHVQEMYQLKKQLPDATLQDLWFYQNPEDNYAQYVKNKLESDNNERLKVDHPRHLKITWDDFDLKIINEFLHST